MCIAQLCFQLQDGIRNLFSMGSGCQVKGVKLLPDKKDADKQLGLVFVMFINLTAFYLCCYSLPQYIDIMISIDITINSTKT